METKIWTGANGPTAPLRVANKLRRKIALTPPAEQPDKGSVLSTPPADSELSSPPPSTGSSQKSLIPSMRSVRPKERTLARPMPALDEVVERTKRRTFTPPRVFGWGGFRGARE